MNCFCLALVAGTFIVIVSGSVGVAGANQAPTNITLVAGQSFTENVAGAIVGTLSVADPDPGDAHTLSVSDPRFEVVNNQLKLKNGIRVDYEREQRISLDITATDPGNLSVTRTFAVTVGDVPEVRFAAFGDYGYHTASGLVANLVKSLNPDFVITLGDNVYKSAPIDDQVGRYYSDYIGNYKRAYGSGSATNRFFPALGNHEYSDPAGGVNASAYLDYFTLPGNERYYDYEVGPIHFFVLDSDPHEADGTTSTSIQGKWLQARIQTSTSPYNIVYFHHPAYSSGRHGSTPAMQWPFEQWGATAVLSGHDHLYERIMRDDNGDGTMLPYFVDGLGGAGKYDFTDPPVAGSTAQYNADWGTMLVQASDSSINFEFISLAGGGTIVDSYTIDLPAPAAATPK
jgi:calcineurin-like phosphoesterase family protein